MSLKTSQTIPNSKRKCPTSAADFRAIGKKFSVRECIKNLEKQDMKMFNISVQEVKRQMADKSKTDVQMKGVSKALEKNDGLLILDGGTITGMQELGADLYGVTCLWQLQFMSSDPKLIERTHVKYFESGADIGMTATYNARVKYSRYLDKGVQLLANAKKTAKKNGIKRDLLVAAACGAYGSAAIDSLEYDGNYGKEVTQKFLEDEHKIKFNRLIKNKDVDILAYETIPNLLEVKAILNVIKTHPGAKAWIVVSCKNKDQLRNGESFEEFVKLVEKHDKNGQVEAIGVNCSNPEDTTAQIKTMRAITKRALIVYPNYGGQFDPVAMKWINDGGLNTPELFAKEANEWKKLGNPIIVGGCCRTHFTHVEELDKCLRCCKQKSQITSTSTQSDGSVSSNKQSKGRKRTYDKKESLKQYMPVAKKAKRE